MDCVIPGPSVRPFCAAITCLSRIGKELYIDFDVLDGLTLRSLNDAKSVFAFFQYEPCFFDRCDALDDISRKRNRAAHDSSMTQQNRYCVRLALKALVPVVKPRKNVMSLRIVSSENCLQFEFQYYKQQEAIVRVTHRIGVADAQGVEAVVPKDRASELVVLPSVLLRMLEPLKRTSELALIVNDTHQLVTTVTFHAEDVQLMANADAEDAQKNANATIKTETSINYDDLIEHEYNGHPDEDLDENDPNPPPEDISDQTVLVLNMKEFRAMLQFCSQAHVDQELQVSINFFWGGKPLVIEASSSNVGSSGVLDTTTVGGGGGNGRAFTCQLVMATLDHTLLRAMQPASTRGTNSGSHSPSNVATGTNTNTNTPT